MSKSTIGNHSPGHMHASKGGKGGAFGIKHPGIEKAKAKRNGVSTHEQLEKDSHSSNAKVRDRGNLGLMFEREAKARKGK